MKKYFFFLVFLCFVQAQEIFLLPLKSDEALELLGEADRKSQDKEWEKAVTLYLEILQKYHDKLVFIDSKLYTNAARLAAYRLAALPHEGQTILEKKIALLLKQTQNKQQNIFPSFYAFLSSEKGREFCMQFASELFLREDYQSCISYLQYLSDPFFSIPDVHINRAQLAFCYYASGNKEQLDFWKNFYQKEKQTHHIMLGKEKNSLPSYMNSLSDKILDRALFLDSGSSWPLYGRTLSNSFSTPQALSSLKESYSKKLTLAERPKEVRYFYNERPRYVESPPVIYPIIGDGTIFINNGQKIQAYDLFLSHLRWEFSGLIPQLKTDRNEQVIYSATYHKGYLYANIEGDTPGQQKDTWNAYKIRDVIAERRLVKLNASNGRLVWQVKDEKGDEESFANKASFVTPPLAWGDYLYSGASELSGLFNSYIVAVSPEDGKIVWKSLIGSAQQELNMFGNPVRETVGSPLAAGDGRLYYLTNLGAFCCVDPMSGNILWLSVYDRIKLQKPNNPLFETIYRQSSWNNSPVVLYQDKVYFAPVDSEYIYCLNARTGEKIWQQFRSGYSYFLLVSDNKVLLGGKSIAFLDALTGERLSVLSLNSEEVSGMGVKSGNFFYCPCNKNLHCIDISKEKIHNSWKWNHPMVYPGNIAMADSTLISVSQEYLNVFYDLQTISAILEKQLQQNQEDPLAYLKLADLYLQLQSKNNQSDLLGKAEDFYLKGLRLLQNSSNPNSNLYIQKARRGLFQIYQILSEEKEREGNRTKAHEYDIKSLTLIDESRDAIALYFRIYRYYSQNEEYQKAKEYLEELIQKYGRETYSLPQEGEFLVAIHAYTLLARQYEKLGESRQALDICYKLFSGYMDKSYAGMPVQEWAKKNIARLIQKFGQEIYQKYDEEALDTYGKLKDKEHSSSSLKRILFLYPNTRYASMIYYSMIKKILEENNVRGAVEEMEYFIREYPDARETPYIYPLLVQAYESSKNFSYAKMILKKFKTKYSGQRFSMQQEELDVDAFVQAKLREPEYAQMKEKIVPTLHIWKENTIKNTFSESSHTTLRLLNISGVLPPEHTHKVFFNLGNTLLCRDAKTGEKLWMNDRLGWVYSLGFLGDGLFVWTNNQLVSLDSQTGKVLWEASIPYRFSSIALGKGKIAVVCENYGQNNSTLYLRASSSQEVLWKTNFPGKISGDVIIAEGIVIVYSQNPSILNIYDLNRGNLIKSFPTIPGVRRHWDYYPVLCSEQYLCVILENRWIECYEIPSLKMLWKYDAESLFIPSGAVPSKPFFAMTSDSVIFLKERDSMICLALNTGEIQWQITCQSYSIRKILTGLQGIYVVVRKEESHQLWSLSTHKGSLQWIASLPDVLATIDIVLSEEYLVAMLNRYTQGYQASFFVFHKGTGERLREDKVKGGDRGRTYAEMTIAGGNLWIVKDNIVWIMGD